MKFSKSSRSLAFLFSLLLFSNSYAGHFYDADGKVLSRYDEVWNFVNTHVGDCPEKITFKIDSSKNAFSRFSGPKSLVVLSKKDAETQSKMILAHETSHVCLFKKTKGMSNEERFRFLDEGLANIVGGKIVGGAVQYKKKALKKAKEWAQAGKVSFAQAQEWSTYFGRPPKVDFNAYHVGASFIFFVEDRYGKGHLEALFKSIGTHNKIRPAIKEVFSMSLEAFETQWTRYLMQ